MSDTSIESQMTAYCDELRRRKPFTQGDDICTVFTVRERTLWLAVQFDAVVSIGGFPEYFCRPVLLYIEETAAALLRIRATKTAIVYVRAVDQFFAGGSMIPFYSDSLRRTQEERELRKSQLSDGEWRALDEYMDQLHDAQKAEGYWALLEGYWRSGKDNLSPDT